MAKSLAITSISSACAVCRTVRPRFHRRRSARRSGVTPEAMGSVLSNRSCGVACSVMSGLLVRGLV